MKRASSPEAPKARKRLRVSQKARKRLGAPLLWRRSAAARSAVARYCLLSACIYVRGLTFVALCSPLVDPVQTREFEATVAVSGAEQVCRGSLEQFHRDNSLPGCRPFTWFRCDHARRWRRASIFPTWFPGCVSSPVSRSWTPRLATLNDIQEGGMRQSSIPSAENMVSGYFTIEQRINTGLYAATVHSSDTHSHHFSRVGVTIKLKNSSDIQLVSGNVYYLNGDLEACRPDKVLIVTNATSIRSVGVHRRRVGSRQSPVFSFYGIVQHIAKGSPGTYLLEVGLIDAVGVIS